MDAETMSEIDFDKSFLKYRENMLLYCRTHGYISKHPYGAQEDFKYCPYCGSLLLSPETADEIKEKIA